MRFVDSEVLTKLVESHTWSVYDQFPCVSSQTGVPCTHQRCWKGPHILRLLAEQRFHTGSAPRIPAPSLLPPPRHHLDFFLISNARFREFQDYRARLVQQPASSLTPVEHTSDEEVEIEIDGESDTSSDSYCYDSNCNSEEHNHQEPEYYYDSDKNYVVEDEYEVQDYRYED